MNDARPRSTLWQRFNRMDEGRFGALLITPTALVMLFVLAVPIGYAFVMSLNRIELTISPDWDFAGLKNYADLLVNKQVQAAVPRTLFFAALNVLLTTGGATIMALVLNEPFKGRKWVRVFILLPWAVAPVVSGVMWRYMFHQSYGLINALLRGLGVIDKYVVWFDDPTVALSIASIATAWKALPFASLILLAAMQSIPESLYRASKMDGANAIQRFWFVTFAHIRPTVIFVVVLQIIASLQAFDVIFTLTRGGPGQGTVVLNYLTFVNAFERLSLGSATSLALLLALLIVVLSGLSLSLTIARKPKA
ncbi:MAG TPA: sugar ABC transporter permease [Thermoflexales bacterium]|nr:sugar ABC transporter permease [Anaerolineae bacterium]HQV27543.1 sugar ABC transporter permease [Thermoflexales bacterium]HQX09334.1 sugar ABC transporter permease [Thermoflexales bacterium]HQY23263.1 sugar ABC transporter permease [Thermoflexales bacterium]HQZ52280.1 sugar ABC transporter permease [Thermoflexales bacterium]